VIGFGLGGVLKDSVLLAATGRDSISSASAKTLTVHGTLTVNAAPNANVVLAGGLLVRTDTGEVTTDGPLVVRQFGGTQGTGFIAGACLAVGHFGFGAIFGTISALLDSLDGMVARISGTASHAGEVLDAAVDRYVEFLFLSGLIIYYRQIPAVQIVALLALVGSFMVSYSTAKAEALKVDPPRGSMRRPERAVYLTLGAALSTLTIFWFETDKTFSIFVGYPMVLALGLVGVVGNVSSITRLWFIGKVLRAHEKEAAQVRVSPAEQAVAEKQQDSQISHRPAGIRL
jgi:phosphatidylglycerophosphate synthase